jgi:hypothetical protein
MERAMDTMFADRPVADEAPIASAREPLSVTLGLALAHAAKSTKALGDASQHAVSAGLRFKEIKQRVQAGEAGKVSWADYCAANIPSLSQRTVDTYIRALEHKDAEEALLTNALSSLPVLSAAMRLDPETAAMDKEEMAAFNRCKHHYAVWRAFRGLKEGAVASKRWSDLNKGDGVFSAEMERVSDWLRSIGKSWDDAPGSFKPHRDETETASRKAEVKAQDAARQAKRRAKSSSIREANGGKPSVRRDKERDEQYAKLLMLTKALDAGQLQIINEIIEERWP